MHKSDLKPHRYMYETTKYTEKNNHFSIINAELKTTGKTSKPLEVNDGDLVQKAQSSTDDYIYTIKKMLDELQERKQQRFE